MSMSPSTAVWAQASTVFRPETVQLTDFGCADFSSWYSFLSAIATSGGGASSESQEVANVVVRWAR